MAISNQFYHNLQYRLINGWGDKDEINLIALIIRGREASLLNNPVYII